jgi:hypothetical protein
MVDSMNPAMKFVEPRSTLSPEAAARKLLQIILRADVDVGQFTYAGITNSAFTRGGSTIAEYSETPQKEKILSVGSGFTTR